MSIIYNFNEFRHIQTVDETKGKPKLKFKLQQHHKQSTESELSI